MRTVCWERSGAGTADADEGSGERDRGVRGDDEASQRRSEVDPEGVLGKMQAVIDETLTRRARASERRRRRRRMDDARRRERWSRREMVVVRAIRGYRRARGVTGHAGSKETFRRRTRTQTRRRDASEAETRLDDSFRVKVRRRRTLRPTRSFRPPHRARPDARPLRWARWAPRAHAAEPPLARFAPSSSLASKTTPRVTRWRTSSSTPSAVAVASWPPTSPPQTRTLPSSTRRAATR